MQGTLILDENGCLRVDGGNGDDLLMLWHHNFTLRVSGEKVEVINGQGQVVARVGENMTGGGGEVPFTTIPGLPIEDCPSQKYWQLGDIKPLP